MAETSTSKPINPSQLCVELGRIPLRVIGPAADGTTIVRTDSIGVTALRNGVASHTADPNWTDPNPSPAPPPTDQERAGTELQAVRAKAKAVLDGTDTFTAAQVQKLVAALVLRLTR